MDLLIFCFLTFCGLNLLVSILFIALPFLCKLDAWADIRAKETKK